MNDLRTHLSKSNTGILSIIGPSNLIKDHR
jgi:hypothetical protein